MSSVTLNQLFSSAETNIKSLIPIENLEKNDVIQLCQSLSENLKESINRIQCVWNDQNLLLEKKNSEWQEKTRKYTLASENIRNSSRVLTELEAKLAGLNETISSLQKDKERLESEKPKLEAELAQKRKDKEIALGVGISGAILTLGFGAIPTAAAVTAVTIAITELEKDIGEKIKRCESKQNEINHLNNEKSKVISCLKSEEVKKRNIENKISRLESKRVSLDQDIKLIGKKVTEIKNVQLVLNTTISQYGFLKLDVEDMPDILEIINENDVKSLLDLVTQNRAALGKWIEC